MAAKVMALVVAVAMADTNPRCGEWAAEGECDKNPGYMRTQCKDACDLEESRGDLCGSTHKMHLDV